WHDRGTIVTTTSGRQAVYLIEIEATQPLIMFETSLSNDRVSGLERTTEQANRKNAEGHRAVAGINSDFWDTVSSQAPNGMHIQNGELMVDGAAARPTFGIKATRELLLAGADVNTTVRRPDGVTRVAREVNQPRGTGDLVVYTSRFAASTGTSAAGTEVVLTDVALPLAPVGSYSGTVSQVRINAGNTPIGSGEVILSGNGAAATFLNTLAVGQTVTFTTAITAGWESVLHASGGGQWIVRNGVIDIAPHDPGFADVTHPRSAIGFTAGGNVILAVVDGRQPGYSVGVRLDELAELMISRGAVTAANLDGGGSSTLAVRLTGEDGVTQVNRGSDGYERSVSNSILLFSSAPTGPLAIATLFPSNASFFVGSATGYAVKGQDAAYNKVAIDPAAVSWSLSNPAVGSIGSTGYFTSTATGSSEVRATIGEVVGSTPATVIDSLSALVVKPNPAVVQPNAQQLFSLTGRNATGGDVIVANHVASWSVSGPIGTIDSAGVLTASAGGSGTVTASAGGASGSAMVDIGRLPEILEDFEDITDMRAAAARATATLTLAARPNPVRSGTTSGRLTYNFTGQPAGTSAAYAAHNPFKPISDRPLRVGIWLYGDGSRHWVRGHYRDANNVQKVLDFTAAPTPAPITKADCAKRTRGIDWVGWKYLEAPIDATAPLPLKWERVYVTETADLCDNASSVYFDDLRAVYSNTSEDLVGPEVSNVFPAPGKRVYTSMPDIGGTVTDPGSGSGVAPESIRLMVDGAQVTATFDPVTGIVRYTPPAPLADGTHSAVLEAEDRAGNPALPFGDWSFIVYTGPDV
ncbi:MAG TPA: phosphodiester glycosidase family protein, partial [Thermoanaerobaculia bacterium]|nr:phosphodiester glycosidase family protein [Thermoanaerobaculia bacterium]